MNIFLAENRQVKIGDLGVAKTMTGDFAKTVVGTPYYLSPEMCEEKPYNEKTDVWALGCLIY
jgi:NIMA (never in mitosis gene a)-related kinase